jgi:A1 cistron-splicing factor AAR2
VEPFLSLHRYQPQTEEVAPGRIDDEVTIRNLEKAIRAKHIEPQRVIPYPRLHSDLEKTDWKGLTSYISTQLLQKHNLHHGDKVVPGLFVEDGENDISHPSAARVEDHDGHILSYPAVPILGDSPLRYRHSGTKKFVSALAPADRTKLLMGCSQSVVLSRVLESYYDKDWRLLLGDLQLAYICLLHLHCLSSLEHWRDVIAMLSYLENLDDHIDLCCNLAGILQLQMKYMDQEFFEDLDFSGDNFFVPAVNRLVRSMRKASTPLLREAAGELKGSVTKLLPEMNEYEQNEPQLDEQAMVDAECIEDGDDDAPVVVSAEDYESSLARANKAPIGQRKAYSADLKNRYPLLFAAVQSHEDVLMTCARVLDEKVDVSVVREAADYLEQVEAKKPNHG